MRLVVFTLLLGPALPAVTQAGEARPGSSSSVTLHWTSPGDNGRFGTATQYDLRYSKLLITESNFRQATRILVPKPGPGGWKESFTLTGLPAGAGYYFALKTADEMKNWSGLSNVVYWDGATVAVNAFMPAARMSLPWPNPARGFTRFQLMIPEPRDVRIEILDTMGRRVRVLATGAEESGVREYSWNFRDDVGRRLDPGIYFVSARVGEDAFTRRVVAVE